LHREERFREVAGSGPPRKEPYQLDDTLLEARQHDVVGLEVPVEDIAGRDVAQRHHDLHKHFPNLILGEELAASL